jgi:hypothetical protein
VSLFILLAASLAAQTTVSAPPLELPALERWVSESLAIPIEPGRTGEWAAATSETLRSEPSLSLDEALARSFVKTYRLDGERAARAHSLLARHGLDVLPGRRVDRLQRTPHGLYSFSDAGLERFDGESWSVVRQGLRSAHGVYEDEAGKLLVGDGGTVYEVEAGRAKPVIEEVGRFRFGPFFQHDGVSYLAAAKPDLSPAMYEKSGDRWTRSSIVEQLGAVGRMAALDGKLYAGAANGVFRKEKDGWKPVLTGVGPTDWIVAHDGKLYARTRRDDAALAVYQLYRLDGETPVRLFPDSHLAYAVRKIGRNLTAIVDGKLHELLPSGWVSVLEDTGQIPGPAAEFGDEAYVQTEAGIYRGLDGVWTRIFEGSPWIGEVFEHLGIRWMTTDMGLARLSGGRMEIAIPGAPIKGGAAPVGRDVLVGTDAGVRRLMFGPEELPLDWREKVLEQLVQRRPGELDPIEPLLASETDIRRSGRTVFSRLIPVREE